MAKKTPAAPQSYEETRKKQAELLKNTPDEEIGKMYRQHKEATDFFMARGLYV